jgi:hypothetical protein
LPKGSNRLPQGKQDCVQEEVLKAVVFIKSIEAMQILPSKTPSIPNEAKIRTKKKK